MEAGVGEGEAAGEIPPGPPGLLGQLLLLLLLPDPQLANWPCRRASAVEGEDGPGDRILVMWMRLTRKVFLTNVLYSKKLEKWNLAGYSTAERSAEKLQ